VRTSLEKVLEGLAQRHRRSPLYASLLVWIAPFRHLAEDSLRRDRTVSPDHHAHGAAADLALSEENLTPRADVKAEAGFSLMRFYSARGRDSAFRAAWAVALAEPPAAERRAHAYEARGEVRIAAANRRVLQRRRRRHVRFTAERQALFLANLADSCDAKASAAAAGVAESTVHRHARIAPGFGAAYREALADGYVRLETEMLRQRLAARENLREAMDDALDNPPLHLQGRGGGGVPSVYETCPHCGRSSEAGLEFDRIMKLLARWDRKPRKVETRFRPGGRRQAWTFDQAIDALDAKLRALGVRREPVEGEE